MRACSFNKETRVIRSIKIHNSFLRICFCYITGPAPAITDHYRAAPSRCRTPWRPEKENCCPNGTQYLICTIGKFILCQQMCHLWLDYKDLFLSLQFFKRKNYQKKLETIIVTIGILEEITIKSLPLSWSNFYLFKHFLLYLSKNRQTKSFSSNNRPR